MSDSDRTLSILDYAAEELAEVERLQAEEDAAAAEVERIDKAIHEAELAFYRRKDEVKRPDRRQALAAAALAGVEAPPEPPIPPGPTLEDLQATIDGLDAMRKTSEDTRAKTHAALRLKVIEVFTAGAERAAEDYLSTARRLEALHTAIGAAEEVSRQGLVGDDWESVCVPNSSRLRALEHAGVVRGAAYLRLPVVAGGDTYRSRVAAAHAAARSEIRARLGGRWPMDRG